MHDGKWQEITYLTSLISSSKQQKINEVLANRTRYVTVALENIEQPHNASAVLRSSDIFGVQDVHVIEEQYHFTPQNTIAKGALKWIDIYRYSTTQQCIATLKKKGYCVVATTPHERDYTLPALPLNQKVALLFGTEVTGLSKEALAGADAFVTIPMFGFTESFNISVSTSICLYHIISQLHQSQYSWKLSDQERDELHLRWLKRILHMDRKR